MSNSGPGIREPVGEALALLEEVENLAAQYALSHLPVEVERAVDLLAGSVLPRLAELLRQNREAIAMVAGLAKPVIPPSGLTSRLAERLVSTAVRITPPDQRQWTPAAAPGIEICRLHTDRESGLSTSLVRMQAGAQLAPHRHDRDEQCLVLEGEIYWGGRRYLAGDFLVGRGGAELPEFTAPVRNLLLVISPAESKSTFASSEDVTPANN